MSLFNSLSMTKTALCSLLLISGVAMAESKNLPALPAKPANAEAQAIIDGLSPMPPEPTIRGIRYVFWHAIRDLRQPMESWLNPNNTEQYSYQYMPTLAPDPIPTMRIHAELYEQLIKDYKEVLSLDYVDELPPVDYMWEPGQKRLPFHLRYRLDAAEAIRSALFRPDFHYKNLLTILNRQMWDQRYIFTFFLWSHVDRGHKPLEAIASMSQSSKRGIELIERLVGSIRQDMQKGMSDVERLKSMALRFKEGDEITGKHGDALDNVKEYDNKTKYRLEKLSTGLYKAAQVANDIVNRNEAKVKTKEGLAEQMKLLGSGLRGALWEIDDHRDSKKKGLYKNGYYSRKTIGIQLTDPLEDLDKDLAVHGGYSELPSEYRGNFAYKAYTDTLIAQYILAASSMMAKINDLKEGRGGLMSKAGQEAKYQASKMLARMGLNKTPETTSSTAIALMDKDKNPISAANQLRRRDFASPALAETRAQIEEEMWQIFFEEAQLQENKPGKTMCESLMITEDLGYKGGIHGLLL